MVRYWNLGKAALSGFYVGFASFGLSKLGFLEGAHGRATAALILDFAAWIIVTVLLAVGIAVWLNRRAASPR